MESVEDIYDKIEQYKKEIEARKDAISYLHQVLDHGFNIKETIETAEDHIKIGEGMKKIGSVGIMGRKWDLFEDQDGETHWYRIEDSG